jgi:uncharacterized membrane protein/predicted heme/steroid binding protein
MDLSQYLGGLPLHPLVVHFAVVLVPVAALGLILLVLFRALADRFGWLALLVLAVGTGAAFVARQSGEDLATKVGRPDTHAQWGTLLPFVAAALLVVALVWLLLHKADRRADRKRSTGTVVAGLLTVVLALATTGLTVLVGDSGARAVWSGVAATPVPPTTASASPTSNTPSATPTAVASPSASASPSATTGSTFTMDEVAKHNSATDCWAAINGSVYDLTTWINQHPGGSDHILPLCGTDGTSAFNAQHSGEGQATGQLAEFKIGTLA